MSASQQRRNRELLERAYKAERERDEAREQASDYALQDGARAARIAELDAEVAALNAGLNAQDEILTAKYNAQLARAEKAERERDELMRALYALEHLYERLVFLPIADDGDLVPCLPLKPARSPVPR